MTEPTINALGVSRYQSYQEWMGVPIATSTGKPKWMPGIEDFRAVTPYGIFGQYDTEFSFRVAYLKRLDEKADEIHRTLLRLSDKYPGQRLVMLCWDDLTKPDGWCHRTMLTEWLAGKGVEAPELEWTLHGPPQQTASLHRDTGEILPPTPGTVPLFGDDFL